MAPRYARRAAVIRRRVALAAAAAIAAIAGAVVGAGDGGETAPRTASIPPPRPTCPAEIAADPRRLAGQALVVRMESLVTAGLLRATRRGRLGGVVLFPAEDLDQGALRAELARLERAARRSGAPVPLVMIDQEGGEVKRLAEAPPRLTPAEIAAAGAGTASRQGRATGRALARLGISIDLAPVLDLAASPESFIASRSFGSDPERVSRLGVAFGEGLQEEGVAATAKHFPGLGLATTNTDLAPSSIEASRRALAPGLRPFEAATEAGFGLVMVANAVYPAYDSRRPASLSPRVIELLRGRLGFEGVVVTDDLGAAAITAAGIDEGEAAVAAVDAGADLALFALSDGSRARDALLRALRRGRLDRERLLDSCARVTALRERLATGSASP